MGTIACKARQDSQLRHDWEATGRADLPGSVPCAQNGSGTRDNFPKATKFLQELAGYLISQAGGKFKDSLGSRNVCIHTTNIPPGFVLGSAEELRFAAFANSAQGSITIAPDLFLHFSTEDLAATVAHELSHIALGHHFDVLPARETDPWYPKYQDYKNRLTVFLRDLNGQSMEKILERGAAVQARLIQEFNASNLPQVLGQRWSADALVDIDWQDESGQRIKASISESGNAALQRAFSQYLAFREQVSYLIFGKLPAELKILQEEISAAQTAVLGQAVVANWSEQEADEVGLEVFARSGFDEGRFSNFMRVLMTLLQRDEDGSCRRNLALERPAQPSRGTASHPDICWRIWNIDFQERRKHRANLDALRSHGSITRFRPTVSLDEVRAEVRAGAQGGS